MGPTKSGGSLLGLPVVRWICNCEKGTSEPIVRERALQRRPRHLDQFSLIHAEALTRHGIFRADTTAEIGRVVGSEAGPHPGGRAAHRADGPRSSRTRPVATLLVGQTSRIVPRSASSATRAGSSIARTPCAIRVTGSASAPRTDSAPACSPAWTLQPSPESAAISYARANGPGGKPASSPASWKPTTYGWRSSASRRASASADSTPWLRTAAARIRASIPWSRARVVDPRRDPAEVLGVGEPHRVGVAGRGDQLDVDAALGRARGEVLVGDVAVVLGGADHARREVVGGEEVQEIRPAEGVLVREQTVGQRDPVALGEPAHERRGRGALQVHVQLGLGDHVDPPRHRGPRLRSAASPTRTAARSAASAASAPGLVARVHHRQRAVRADLGADGRDLREPDGGVDPVLLARAVAAEAR